MVGLSSSLFICAIDQTAHESLESLHAHLRKLKVKQEDYYTQYAPQRDRCTGEVIPFKAPASHYLKREFIGKRTFSRWLKEQPDQAREWAVAWLAARKEEKQLFYAPCQVELRSLLCPSQHYYDQSFEGGYKAVCESVGLQPRFGGQVPATIPALDCPVVIDTREQKPLQLAETSVRSTLRSADYGLPPERDQLVYIERKSLGDFIGTLSARETRPGDSNLQRFTRELERAAEIGAYVIMLVEQKLDDCLAYNDEDYSRYLARQHTRVKVTPEHLFHNLRDLFHRFPHTFQALFVNGREEAATAVVQLLVLGDVVKSCDLQWEYECGRLVT